MNHEWGGNMEASLVFVYQKCKNCGCINRTFRKNGVEEIFTVKYKGMSCNEVQVAKVLET